MFAGEFPCKPDDKGRFAVPSSLREHFAVPHLPGTKKAVLVKSQQEPCLWLFPIPNWYALLEYQQERLSDQESRLFMHYMVSEVVETEIDRTSRVLIPRKLLEHADLKEDSVLVGLYDRLEIWNPDTWHLRLSELEDEHEMSLGKVLQLPTIKPPFPGEASRL
jgi:MraZ protein